MLSKKNRILATNYKQRWAIRKLTVGVVSVLLGGTMLFISGTTVSADNLIPKNESVSKVEEEVPNNSITEEKSINTSSEVITKETKGTDTTIDKTTLNVSEIDQQNNVASSETVPEKVQEITTMSDVSVELDNNTPTSEVEKVQSQPTVFSYQPKESDSRKAEDGDNGVTYYVIVREVTIVKPNGDEEILPYESMDTLYYEIESENDDLPLINFKAIDVPPIPGAKSPVIPGISRTVNSFMEDDINEILDTSYVKSPVQRISGEVIPLPEEEKYDEPYYLYEPKYEEYEKKFAKGDIKLIGYDGLLIKEKYRYILDDDPKPIEGKEEKTITRTINVHLPNGEVQTTKQPVTLERKYTSVAGSDEKKYGPWTVGRWESFTAPEQEGYTAIPGTVDEAEVTSESLDAVVDIYYRADEPAIVEGKEEKTITRTINVHLPNGEVQTTKQPVTLERKYTSVAGSDEKKYGPWTVGRWESFTAPEQEGYTAIPGTVDEVEVTSESLDAVADIYYRVDEPAIVEGKEEKTITRTINVHLPNGEVQTTKQPVTLERKYTSVADSDEKKYGPWTVGRWESFTAPEQEGYTAIPGAVDEVEVTSESLDAVVDIYYRADEPAIVEGKEEKTITRTINVHLPNGEVQTTKQPVTLERKYTSVEGSDEKKYGPWTVGRWESFTAPEQEGYTAIPGTVDEVKVTSESLDAVVDIYYRADEPAIVEGKEEKTITRTINVHLPNGEVQTTKQPVTLERKYTSVAGSDEKKYGPWTVGRWESFTAPEQEGYTAIPGTVDEVKVTSESLDAVVDIYYRADEPAIVEGKEEKTITRTINVHLPNGEVQTTRQPVTLERKYTSVAGSDEKKYGPWTVGRWESFTAPEQEGYTAIPGTVDEVKVTSESLDAVVDIYYRADESAIVEGKEEKTITRTINVHLPNGEVQTTKQPVTLERKYTSVAGSDEKKYGPWTVGRWESFTAPEQEGYTAIPGTVDEVKVTSESLDAVVDIYYRADEPAIVEGKEEKTITRTINVHLPNGEVQTTRQPVTLERKYTSVAGSDEKKYGPWTVGRWESFTAPEQEGYTAIPGTVDEVKVTSESLDAVVDIYYRADEPAIVEGKEEKTITRTINVHLPNGEVQTTKQPVTLERKYTSVAGSDEKKYGPWTVGRWESFTAPEQEGYTAIPGAVDEVKVTSESLDAVVDIYYRADEPAIVEGKEEKTITRTINVHLPNGEVQTTRQPVTLERKYTSVAGSDEKKYGPWTVGRWESFTAPEQEGYTAIPGTVDEVKVTSESLDAVVDIYYRADEPTIVEGKEEKTITRTINVHLPNGEVQTTRQPVTLERKYTSVAGSDEKKYGPWTVGRWESFTAPEQEGYTAIPGTVDEVKVTSESLDAVVDIYYRADEPAIVEGKEEKTITRTINVHLPNGEVQTTKQPVTLERKYTSVAGSDEKKYGPWTVGRWESFTAPEQEGYTAIPGTVDEVKVTSESLDAVVDIYYRADEPAIVEGKEEKTITRTINVHLPNGEVQTTRQPVTLERKYTSVAGSDEKKYGPWTVGRWESFTAPEQEGYTAIPGTVDEVKVTSESLDAVVDIYYRADEPAIVEGKEEKTITRTINVHLPNGEVQTTKQPVTLERKYTSVAGSDEKKYGPWTVGRWESFTAPEQEGYTAIPGTVDEVKVTSESLDAVVDIYYRADEPAIVEGKEEKTITRTINVHLPNGEVQTTRQPVTLERKYTSVAGSDEKKYGPWTVGRWESFTAPEQEGYTAIPGTVDEVKVTSESLDAVVDIYYRADEPTIVEGKEEKTITRTINVHLPNGEVQTTRQPVTLERKYTSVAGSDEKKYGPWTVGRWESFTAPEQEGYTAIPGTVDEVKVTSESLDAVVDIYYRADEPAIVEGKEEKTITRTINVHLPNGEVQTTKQPVTLERKYTSVAGSDEKKYGPWTVGRWESFTAPEQEGYTAIPGTVDEVKVTSESLDAVVDIYYRADEPAIVEGKEEKTITRTINVHLPNGEVQTTRQPVTLERKYTSVAGSDEKKYGPWTVGRWESFTAPEQEGYTAIPGTVDEVKVTSESLDAVVDIYYRADEPAIVEGKEEKTITRTINVHLPNGEVQTTRQPVTLERKYTSVAGSDEKKYGPWTVGRWESFTAPEQEGYTAIPGTVDEVKVTSESLDAVVDIYYRADESAIVEGKEEKTITRTINVHLPNGEVQTTRQPVTLERKYTSVAGSDEKKYGPWTVGRWESFTAPEQEGYTAIPGTVDEVKVTSESLDAVVDIYYRADEPAIVEGKEEKTITRTINVHLPNGEVQTTKQPVTLERKYTSVAGSDEKKYGPWTVGRWESFTAPEQEGYTAIPGTVDEVKVTSESLDAVVDIYYRADEPAIVEGKEEKTITRTINVHLPNGEVQTTRQPVTLERKYTSVAGSDEKKYGPWTVGRWESFTAPEQEGYTAIPGTVDEVKVTSESLDAVVDIYYRADESAIVEGKEEKTITRTINVHLPNGEVQTTKQPVTLERKYTSVAGSDEKKYGPWTVGRWESFTAPEQEGYTAIPGAVDEVEVTSESLDAVVDIYYRADEPAIVEESEEVTDDPTPETSTTSPTPKNITNAKGKTATPELKNMDTKSKVFQNKLPQTGNKAGTIYSIIGLLLTSILGVWEIIRKR